MGADDAHLVGTPDAFDDASETFTDLEEGSYTCTVVIERMSRALLK